MSTSAHDVVVALESAIPTKTDFVLLEPDVQLEMVLKLAEARLERANQEYFSDSGNAMDNPEEIAGQIKDLKDGSLRPFKYLENTHYPPPRSTQPSSAASTSQSSVYTPYNPDDEGLYVGGYLTRKRKSKITKKRRVKKTKMAKKRRSNKRRNTKRRNTKRRNTKRRQSRRRR